MPENQSNVLASFWKQVAASRLSLLLLDYDGTLAPFQVDRYKAYPYPGVLPLLAEILRSDRTRVIIVTGRPIQEVTTLLSPLSGIEIWGAHGLDYLQANGNVEHFKIDSRLTDLLNESEKKIRARGFSDLIEVKPGGVAIHWRGLSEQRIIEIQSAVQNEWNFLAEHPDIKLLQFEGGLELRIARPNKGDAIRSIIRTSPINTPVTFLGDDITDEDGFAALSHHGLPILVKETYRPTAAKAWIRPPNELLDFLEEWKRQTA